LIAGTADFAGTATARDFPAHTAVMTLSFTVELGLKVILTVGAQVIAAPVSGFLPALEATFLTLNVPKSLIDSFGLSLSPWANTTVTMEFKTAFTYNFELVMDVCSSPATTRQRVSLVAPVIAGATAASSAFVRDVLFAMICILLFG
jgi:hypothetical protein